MTVFEGRHAPTW